VVYNNKRKKQRELGSPFPQGSFTAEFPKAVGKIGLVAGVFEAKCGAEVDQCRFVHSVAVFAKKKHQYHDYYK
jgi:hypothetical protein